MNMRQKEVAAKAGITQNYYSDLETGKKKNPSVSVLARLADVLGCTVDELIADRSA